MSTKNTKKLNLWQLQVASFEVTWFCDSMCNCKTWFIGRMWEKDAVCVMQIVN